MPQCTKKSCRIKKAGDVYKCCSFVGRTVPHRILNISAPHKARTSNMVHAQLNISREQKMPSCMSNNAEASPMMAPRVASMAHLPWISSHSLKRSKPNTSSYGAKELLLTLSFFFGTAPMTFPGRLVLRFWSRPSRST